MLRSIIILSIISLMTLPSIAQPLRGKVVEWDESMNMEMPLTGANAHWMNTTESSTADNDGNFKIEMSQPLPAKLIVSFVGYQNDTTEITNNSFRKIVLKKSVDL